LFRFNFLFLLITKIPSSTALTNNNEISLSIGNPTGGGIPGGGGGGAAEILNEA